MERYADLVAEGYWVLNLLFEECKKGELCWFCLETTFSTYLFVIFVGNKRGSILTLRVIKEVLGLDAGLCVGAVVFACDYTL